MRIIRNQFMPFCHFYLSAILSTLAKSFFMLTYVKLNLFPER